jgi:hypothetical protein
MDAYMNGKTQYPIAVVKGGVVALSAQNYVKRYVFIIQLYQPILRSLRNGTQLKMMIAKLSNIPMDLKRRHGGCVQKHALRGAYMNGKPIFQNGFCEVLMRVVLSARQIINRCVFMIHLPVNPLIL